MAALTLYATNSLASVFQELSGTDPGAEAYASPTTGWVVGTGSTNRSEFRPQSERAANTFDSTGYPDGSLDSSNGDGFRSASAYTGNFASGNWTFYFSARANTSGTGQDYKVHYRVFRSADANGSSATEISSGTVSGSTVTNLTTSATQVSSASFNPGAVSLSTEYLFVQVACERTGAASMSNADVNMRIGGANSTRLVTPEFTPGFSLSVDDMTQAQSLGNITVTQTATAALASLEITLSPPSGFSAHGVANIDEIANWRCIYYGLGVEVGDRILYDNTGGASVDSDGLVTGVASLAFHWRDADNDGGTWTTNQTWVSQELIVQSLTQNQSLGPVFFPGNAVGSKDITLSPPAGYSIHTVTDVSQASDPGCIYYQAETTITVTDPPTRYIYTNTSTDNDWPITIDGQGFIIIDAGGDGSPDSFEYAIRDPSDESWSPTFGAYQFPAIAASADMAQAQSLENVSLTQHNILVVASLTQAQSEENVSLTPHLIVDDLAQDQEVENVDLLAGGPVTVNALAQAQTLEAVVLTQHNVLDVDGIAQSQTFSEPPLLAGGALSVDGILQDQSVENVLLATLASLAVQDIAQAQGSGNITLTQHNILVVNDSTQAQSLAAPTLTQHGAIIVQGLAQTQSLEGALLDPPDIDADAVPFSISSEGTIQSFTERRRLQ